MDHVTIQDTRVPALGLGTWRLTGRSCQQSVEAAIEMGYRHIDTAQMYGNEAEVGAGIEAAGVDPGDLFVTTKIANGNHAPDAVRSSTEESLRKLRLDAVDLLLIHHPVETEILDETLAAMTQLRDEGVVRHLGVSNFSVDLLERAVEITPLFAVQIEYHPFLRQDEQLEAARRHGLLFQAYSPLARSGVVGEDVLEEVARRHDATAAQVALRWLMDQENVAAIPKASSREHLEENWRAQELRLEDSDRERIDQLTHRQQPAREVGV